VCTRGSDRALLRGLSTSPLERSMSPATRRILGLLGLLFGVMLVLRAALATDPGRDIHIIAGLSLVIGGGGLMMGLGGKG
jgi:hypothetical protein